MQDPEYQTVRDRRANSVHDHGTCNSKKLCAHSRNKSLAFEFDCRGRHGVRKAGYRNKRSRAGVPRKLVVNPQRGEQHSERDH